MPELVDLTSVTENNREYKIGFQESDTTNAQHYPMDRLPIGKVPVYANLAAAPAAHASECLVGVILAGRRPSEGVGSGTGVLAYRPAGGSWLNSYDDLAVAE